MEFRLLGPVEVVEDGVVLPLPRRKQRALLAALLLRPGETIPADRLVDELWGGRPPSSAVGSLHNLVSQLRRVLGAEAIATRPPGYAFVLPRQLVDVWEFERLVAAGRPREALALWRGPALADLVGEPLADVEASRLEERRTAAWEAHFDLELAAGRGSELVADLERLVAEHPHRERFRAQLMRALYRAGRQADALEAYREARTALVDELGLEPSPELQELQAAILRQDPELAGRVRAAPAAELRKTVTVVAVDAADVPEDPEAYARAAAGLRSAVADAVARHGGDAVAALGVFGHPEVREDDVVRATRAALELATRAGTRVGVATGEVLAGAEGVVGAPVAIAEELSRNALPGEVLAAPSTLALLGGAAESEEVERIGAVVPARIVALDPGALMPPRSHTAPLVGRRDELDRLLAAARRSSASVVTVIGEPGVGKTRLAAELAARLEPEVATKVGRCVPYGAGASWTPVVEALGPRAADAVEGRAPGEAAWALARLLEELAGERPLVLVLEDVHWAQPAVLDFVEFLRRSPPAAAVLVLALTRPDLLELRPGWADTETLLLEPLADEEARALLARLGQTDDRTSRRIVATAGGNPLFLEQLTAHVSERRPDAALPATIESVLASRLEDLHREERATLERAAVAGIDLDRDAIVRLAGTPVDRPLLALVRRGLLRATRERDRLRFHHALVRDVAYGGIPRRRRAAMHEALASWLEEQAFPRTELLGWHLERAHADRAAVDPADPELADLAVRAGRALSSSGIGAWQRADAPAAVDLLGRAVALLPRELPERREALLELGLASRLGGGAGTEAFREALLDAESEGDRATELRARLELAMAEDAGAEELIGLADLALPWFADSNDRAAGRALLLRGAALGAVRGRNLEWLECAERAAERYRRAGWPPAWCFAAIAAALVHGPTPVEHGIARCEAMRSETEPGTHGRAQVTLFLAALTAMRGDDEGARSSLREAEETLAELGLSRLLARDAAVTRAGIELLAGAPAAAVGVLERSCAELDRLGDRAWAATQRAALASALVSVGRHEAAAEVAWRAADDAAPDDLPSQYLWRAALARAVAPGKPGQAEALVREATRLVRTTDALNQQAEVELAAAEVEHRAGRPERAEARRRRAVLLLQRKGNVAGARLARNPARPASRDRLTT